MVAQLANLAEQLGLPFGKRTRTYNSRLAQELGLWAEDQNKGDSFHKAAFHAYFAQGLNLAEHSVLLDLIEQTGLNREMGEEVLQQRRYKARVDKDWRDSQTLGITAVPTLLMGGHKIIGNQSYDILEQLVVINNIEKRNSV